MSRTRLNIKTGEVFSRLTVIGPPENTPTGYHYMCQCVCGNQKLVRGAALNNKQVQSCGCLRNEALGKGRKVKHGHFANYTPSPTYITWQSMIKRCTNPKCQKYCYYGGRGITVCPEWMKFENFLADMGERPSGMSLDRINNNGNYEPVNCRWADGFQQHSNRRDNRLVTFNGTTECLALICRNQGLTGRAYQRVRMRLQRGWTIESALTLPKYPANRNRKPLAR